MFNKAKTNADWKGKGKERVSKECSRSGSVWTIGRAKEDVPFRSPTRDDGVSEDSFLVSGFLTCPIVEGSVSSP